MESMGSGPGFCGVLRAFPQSQQSNTTKKNARLQTCSQTGVLEFTWLLAVGCWD